VRAAANSATVAEAKTHVIGWYICTVRRAGRLAVACTAGFQPSGVKLTVFQPGCSKLTA
jgi:hypothetical protein